MTPSSDSLSPSFRSHYIVTNAVMKNIKSKVKNVSCTRSIHYGMLLIEFSISYNSPEELFNIKMTGIGCFEPQLKSKSFLP